MPGAADDRGEGGGAALAPVGEQGEQRQPGDGQGGRDRERDRPRLPDPVLVAVIVAGQLRSGPLQPLGERLLGDPAGVGVVGLLEGDRREQRRGDRHGGDRDRGAPPLTRPEQQQSRLGRNHEAGEIVRGESQRRNGGPPAEVPPVGIAQGPGEEEEGEGGEQEDEGVGAGVLGEPDQHRADRDHRRGDQSHSAREGQCDGAQVDDDDRSGSGQRRERAQADLADPERARPQPRHQIVEGRRRFAAGDGGEGVEEARVQDADDGDGFVVAVALQVEGREAKRRAERDDPRQHQEVRRLHGPPPNVHGPRGYGASPPGGGGGGVGKAGANAGKTGEASQRLSTARLAGKFWIR